MKNLSVCLLVLAMCVACKNDHPLEAEIGQVPVEFQIERVDLAFGSATPADLPELKRTFPFIFSSRTPDSLWVAQMNDTLQQQLSSEVKKAFDDFGPIHAEIRQLFQHLKYYDPAFSEPRIATVTSYVDYRYKTIVTDTVVIIALDTYLGPDHEFYAGIPNYIAQNMDRSNIVSDLAGNYADLYVFQSQRKSFLDEMIYFGKKLYFKDRMIPFKTDAEKIEYTPEQLEWAITNESQIWSYFIERELLYSTDSALPGRFIADAPFSKFYLELDSESPGRIGQYIGWQIVKAYMDHNDVSWMDMLRKDAEEIFVNSKFKPKK